MRVRTMTLVVGELFAFAGCTIAYPLQSLPADERVETGRKVFRPKCLYALRPKTNGHVLGSQGYNDALAKDLDKIENQLRECGAFSSCLVDGGGLIADDQVRIVVDCNVEYEMSLEGVLCAVSLGLFPGRDDMRYTYVFSVRDNTGREAQYQFTGTVRAWIGFLVFPFMGACETSTSPVVEKLQRYFVAQLIVKMQRDGFFSAEGRDKAATAKADAVETLKKNAAARRKELEDLKKAGIIDETEYAAEVQKLGGTGK